MLTFSVNDVGLAAIQSQMFDLAVFCSGYEERCIHFASRFEGAKAGQVEVLGFRQLSNSDQRKRNDSYFRETWHKEPVLLSGDDDAAVYQFLGQHCQGSVFRVLVDYSSMSRLWYAAILNWARSQLQADEVEIVFVYSTGVYENQLIPIVIEDILAIPGCEGGALRFGDAVAIFGLGFYSLMTECVYEQLEPDRVYAFLSSPGASPEYAARVLSSNDFLIQHSDAVIEVPLSSVETAVRYLAELVLPHRPHSEVVLIPMGPKPHVLASILLSMRFGDICCLRVSARRERPEAVRAAGEILATRVVFKGEEWAAQTRWGQAR